MPIVYRITCKISEQQYFGWTVYTLAERFSKHCRSKKDYYISRCIQKYKKENFITEEVFFAFTNEDAAAIEIELIAEHKTNISRYPDGKGMNMTDGGEWGTQGYRHTKVAKQKIQKSSLGRKRTKKTQELINRLIKERGAHWNKGRITAEETKKKQSESLKKAYAEGRRKPRKWKPSKEHKAKISAALKGKKFTKEHRKKISQARKGIKFSAAHRQKIREFMLGRKRGKYNKKKYKIGLDLRN